MLHSPSTRIASLLVAAYVCAAGVSFVCARINVLALTPGEPTDLTYYLQFAAKGLERDAHAFFVPTIGTSILYTGADARTSLHKGIHFEPLKYVTAVVYSLTHSSLSLFVFYILFFFSPLLYSAFLVARKAAGRELLLAAAGYALVPAAYSVAIDDLRPFILTIAFFALTMLACLYRRPRLETLSFLTLLLLSREEGLILALPILAFVGVRAWRSRTGMKEMASLCGVWCAGFCVVCGYMWWVTDVYAWRSFGAVSYTVSRAGISALQHPVLTSLCGMLSASILFYVLRRFSHILYARAEVFTFGALTGVFLIAAPVFRLTPPLFSLAILDGRYGMLLFLCGGLTLLAWALSKNKLPFISTSMGVLCLVGMVLASLAYHTLAPSSALRRSMESRGKVATAELVWAARSVLDDQSVVIVDGRTEQALFNLSPIVLVRLPARPVSNPEDFYPYNAADIAKAIDASPIRFALLEASSMPLFLELLTRIHKTAAPMYLNEAYGFYQIR